MKVNKEMMMMMIIIKKKNKKEKNPKNLAQENDPPPPPPEVNYRFSGGVIVLRCGFPFCPRGVGGGLLSMGVVFLGVIFWGSIVHRVIDIVSPTIKKK